jgi:hypothetical protein
MSEVTYLHAQKMGVDTGYGQRTSSLNRFTRFLSNLSDSIYGGVAVTAGEGGRRAKAMKSSLDANISEIGKMASQVASLVAIPAFFGVGGDVTRNVYGKAVQTVGRVQDYESIGSQELDAKLDELEYMGTTELPVLVESQVSDEYRRQADIQTRPTQAPSKKKKKKVNKRSKKLNLRK